MYDLHSLGWNSFQQLCLTITREVLGQTVESFLDSNDGGRDGAFVGQWNPTGHEDLSGRFVIQCKFTSRINHVLRPSDLSDEVTKGRKLVEQRLCDSYVLMTNAGLSGSHAEEIEALLRGVGAKHFVLFGSTWIGQQIRENKRLRMLVPQGGSGARQERLRAIDRGTSSWQDNHCVHAGNGRCRPMECVHTQTRRSRQSRGALEPGRTVTIFLAPRRAWRRPIRSISSPRLESHSSPDQDHAPQGCQDCDDIS